MKFVFFNELDTDRDIAVPVFPGSVTGLRQTKVGTEIRIHDGYIYNTPTGIRVVAEELEKACPDITAVATELETTKE